MMPQFGWKNSPDREWSHLRHQFDLPSLERDQFFALTRSVCQDGGKPLQVP
jgi:hypothetical protein